MVPPSAFVSTRGHISSLEAAQTGSEEVINQKGTYNKDRELGLNAQTAISKKSCEDITSPVSFNEPTLSANVSRSEATYILR